MDIPIIPTWKFFNFLSVKLHTIPLNDCFTFLKKMIQQNYLSSHWLFQFLKSFLPFLMLNNLLLPIELTVDSSLTSIRAFKSHSTVMNRLQNQFFYFLGCLSVSDAGHHQGTTFAFFFIRHKTSIFVIFCPSIQP